MRGICKELFSKLQDYKGKDEKSAIPIIRYLVYLLVVITAISGVSLARYTANSASNSDAARVAGFDVTVELLTSLNEDLGSLTDYFPNDFAATEKKYEFTVTNDSEVAIRARVVMEYQHDSSVEKSAWVDIAPNGASQNVAGTVKKPQLINALFFLYDINVYVEYEQLD